jgi:hypothetical protein
VGGHVYSFADWKDGFLRGNRKKICGAKAFAKGDSRLDFVVRKPDPRVHFALDWGTVASCPISFYSVENLNEELDIAARAYCEQHVEIDLSKVELKLSKVFQWYKTDFVESSKQLPTYLMPYLLRLQKQDMEKLVYHKSQIKITYKDYDWNSLAKHIRHFTPSSLKTVNNKFRNSFKHSLVQVAPAFVR